FAAVDKGLSERRYVAVVQRFQPVTQLAITPFVAFRPGIDHQPARQSSPRSLVPPDEMVSAQDQQRLVEHDLAIGRLFGLDFFRVTEDDNFAEAFRSAEMNAHSLMIFDALGRR